MGKVHHVVSDEEFKQLLIDAGDKLVVVDFFATWCGPCKRIAPEVEKLASLPENQNVVFLKVDVDEVADTAQNAGIKAMPTFIFYKNNKKVGEIVGADVGSITSKIKELK